MEQFGFHLLLTPFVGKKIFDVGKLKVEVGLFSEIFRKKNKYFETKHPIFSFCVSGKLSNFFQK